MTYCNEREQKNIYIKRMGSKTKRNKKQNKNKTKPPLAKNYRGPRSVIGPHRADERPVSMGEAKKNEEKKRREEKRRYL